MQSSEIKKILIVGGGTAGWMTAAALSKTIGCQEYEITLVESEQIGTVGVGEATIPTILLLNSLLEINEDEFIRETHATFKLGIEFVNWRRVGHAYFHPFGPFGMDMDGIGFYHYWMRWRQEGGNLDYSRFSVETEAARAMKFSRSGAESHAINMPRVNYAFQFDAGRYATFLRRYAEARGVHRCEGIIQDVKLDNDSGDISSVTLVNGTQLDADLFIDCSGFKALLIEGALKTGFTDWSHWLPTNKAVTAPCASTHEFLPYTRATAQESGWQWRIPLQHRTGNGYVYASQFIDDQQATDALVRRLDGTLLADPKIVSFTAGRRKKCWKKNCIAIGLSSGFLEPLESTSIHLIQATISKLLSVFPVTKNWSLLQQRFNRDMEKEYDNIKDFLIAHYKVTERDDTPFWQYVKNMEIPDTLKERLEMFNLRGEIMVGREELFREPSWCAVLTGQGMSPKSYHPMANSLTSEELQFRLAALRDGIQSRLRTMSTHAEFIQNHCRSSVRKIANKSLLN